MLFLRNYGVAEIAISAGAEPIRFANAETAGAIPVPRVDAVDTNGAGDVLHGAYCYYVGLRMGSLAALEQAARIATESVRFRGISGWVRPWNTVAIEHGC